jgi:hypothetical protein
MNKKFLFGVPAVLFTFFWFVNAKETEISSPKLTQNIDSLKTDTVFSLEMQSNTTFEFVLSQYEDVSVKKEELIDLNTWTYRPLDTISIYFGDYQFPWENGSNGFKPWYGFDIKEVIKYPESLNLHSPNSSNDDLDMLKSHSLERIEDGGFFGAYGWESGGGEKLKAIFHEFMTSKITRDIIFESILSNFNEIENELTVYQKRVFALEIKHLIQFCNNYNANRKKYLNGNLSVIKNGFDYNSYGYESNNEGFIFRRIEVDNISPTEISQYLSKLLDVVNASFNKSKYFSNASSSINNGELIVNSYIDSKGKIGFLLHSNLHKNSFLVPNTNIYITRLQSNGNSYWRIKDKENNDFFVLDNNLKKIK